MKSRKNEKLNDCTMISYVATADRKGDKRKLPIYDHDVYTGLSATTLAF